MQNDVLTTTELAAHLKVSPATVRFWRLQGMPGRKFGKHVRYDWPTVERWFEERTQKPAGVANG